MAALHDSYALRLFQACAQGNEAATRRLLKSSRSEVADLSTGALVDAQHGADGITALYAAARMGSLGCVTALLMCGASVNLRNNTAKQYLRLALVPPCISLPLPTWTDQVRGILRV